MQGIKGIEINGHEANGGEGGSDLAGNDAALAHAGNHQLAPLAMAELKQLQGRFHLGRVQALGGGGDGLRLLGHNLRQHVRGHRLGGRGEAL